MTLRGRLGRGCCSRSREVPRVANIALRDGQPAWAAVAPRLIRFPAPRTLTSDARAKRELSLAALVTRVGPARDVRDPQNLTLTAEDLRFRRCAFRCNAVVDTTAVITPGYAHIATRRAPCRGRVD
jgi:hypothetical protein